MKLDHFRREVALAAQGAIPDAVAAAERALHKKEYLRCAQALNQFALACLKVTERGDRPRRVAVPPHLLPPVV